MPRDPLDFDVCTCGCGQPAGVGDSESYGECGVEEEGVSLVCT